MKRISLVFVMLLLLGLISDDFASANENRDPVLKAKALCAERLKSQLAQAGGNGYEKVVAEDGTLVICGQGKKAPRDEPADPNSNNEPAQIADSNQQYDKIYIEFHETWGQRSGNDSFPPNELARADQLMQDFVSYFLANPLPTREAKDVIELGLRRGNRYFMLLRPVIQFFVPGEQESIYLSYLYGAFALTADQPTDYEKCEVIRTFQDPSSYRESFGC